MAAGQFVFFVVCSVAIAGVSPTIGLAVWYACCVYGMRTITALGYFIESQAVNLAPGTVVLLASVLALFAGILLRRVHFTIDCPRENTDNPSAGQSEQLSPEGPTVSGGIAQLQELDRLFEQHNLSPREREMAALWLKGMPIRDMAAMLSITERTVKAHVKNILTKFGVVNRTAFLVKLLSEKEANSIGWPGDASLKSHPHTFQ